MTVLLCDAGQGRDLRRDWREADSNECEFASAPEEKLSRVKW